MTLTKWIKKKISFSEQIKIWYYVICKCFTILILFLFKFPNINKHQHFFFFLIRIEKHTACWSSLMLGKKIKKPLIYFIFNQDRIRLFLLLFYVFEIIQNFLKFSLVIMVYNISVILMFDLYSTTFNNISCRMFILFSYGIHCIFSKLITNIAAVIVLTIYL